MHQRQTEAEVLRARVQAHPIGQLERLSANQFQILCREMAGAFPDSVRQAVSGTIVGNSAEFLSARAAMDVNGPEPNPVDYDWRFDARSASSLGELVTREQYRSVLCVGTPTIYGEIRSRGGDAFLIDRNPLLSRTLTAGTFLIKEISGTEDWGSPINRTFDAAVLDPPWYEEAYNLWLARTMPLLSAGADVFLVLFRRFTRPDAERQRAELLARFEKIGRISPQHYEVTYSTPPFELEVLRRLRLPSLPSWRAADLVKITLSSKPDLTVFQPLTWRPAKWRRFDLGDQVLAVKEVLSDDGPIEIVDELPSEITSVSQRDPSRERYTVWTSRSRAAVVTGTKRLIALLESSFPKTIEEPDILAVNELSQKLSIQIRRRP